MKKNLLSLILVAACFAVSAQVVGTGFYRVRSYHAGRYITVIDNRTKGVNMQTSSVDVNALRTVRPFETMVVSNPGTIMYAVNKGTNSSGDSLYDLKAQGMDTYPMVGAHLALHENSNGTYQAYGTRSIEGTSFTAYLYDTQSDLPDIAYLRTADSKAINWEIIPVSAATENYFGITPTVAVDGKYYASLYADFAFQTYSEGMKVYYVDATKDGAGQDYAELRELSGVVPAHTPVIIECSTNEATTNRLELIDDYSLAAPSDNVLRGVYFENKTIYNPGANSGHENVTNYDPSTMRLLGSAGGKLALIKANNVDYVPANSFYLPVAADADANFICLNPEEYATSIYSLSSDAVAPKAIYNLMGQKVANTDLPGIYIVDGKKMIVK